MNMRNSNYKKTHSAVSGIHIGLIILVLLLFCTMVSAEETKTEKQVIAFSSDTTKASLREGKESIILEGNASVETKSIILQADTIEISGGSDSNTSRFIFCTGSVYAKDSNQNIELTTHALTYDRQDQTLTVNSWVEMNDYTNGIALQGAYLKNYQAQNKTVIQIRVTIRKDTEDGPMVCRTDSALFDGQKQTLELSGDSVIYWNDDIYQAAYMQIDLVTNSISMEGEVSGNIRK